MANLSKLDINDKISINFGLGASAFNIQKPIDKLIHFIRSEKPHFRPDIVSSDLKSAIIVKPKLNNKRIIAQSGAFILFGIDVDMEMMPPGGIIVERIQINGNNKITIRNELDRMAINDGTMFPEIEKAAIYIKNRFLL